jgi:DNA-binding LytR/AlgR family response regulator
MMLDNEIELQNTRVKLRELQERYEALRVDQSEDPRVRRLTMMSLKRLINQLTEEITRFESRPHKVRTA